MKQINKIIKDRLINEENLTEINSNNIIKTLPNENINSHKNILPQLLNFYKYSEIFQNPYKNQNLNLNDIPINNFRRQLIIAKIIISELQESNSNIMLEKKKLESNLNDALNSIKSLHNDYISLTEKFSLVNQNLNNENNNHIIEDNNNYGNIIINLEKRIKEIEEEKNSLQDKIVDLEKKLKNSDDLYKIQEEKYNYKIILLNKKLEMQEYEMKNYKNSKFLSNDMTKIDEEEKNKLKDENLSLRQENIELNKKYIEENKKLLLQLENYKNKIILLKNQNINASSELKEKTKILEKELRINEQYTNLDKHFNNTLQEKNISYITLNEQYNKLLKEFEEYKNRNDKEKEDYYKKYNKIKNENNKLNNMQEEYKHKIKLLKNNIKELKEIKKDRNNFYKDRSINFKTSNKNNSKENDIKGSKDIFNDNNIFIFEDKIYYLKKQNEYILSLLLKVTPNKKLIQQIIDLNFEILQLEKKKGSIEEKIKENPNLNNILPKINQQIKNFKNHLLSLEEELISVDFGSSRNNNNSINSLPM